MCHRELNKLCKQNRMMTNLSHFDHETKIGTIKDVVKSRKKPDDKP